MAKSAHAVVVLGIASTLASCNANIVSQKATTEPVAHAEQASLANDSNAELVKSMETAGIPERIRDLIESGDTLLAYKQINLANNPKPAAVIIVRHPVPAGAFNYSQNPCELLVLHQDMDSYTISGSSAKVVDCTNIAFSRGMAKLPSDLNEYLEVGYNSVTYTNQYAKSTILYSFNYSIEKNVWFLASAINNYSRADLSSIDLENITEEARYPLDIDFITMQDFEPKEIADILEKNKRIN